MTLSTLCAILYPPNNPLHPHELEKFDDRSIWAIVWGCFAMIFACTWIAVHPNVSPATDSRTRVFGRRFTIMGYILLVPEMVILWVAHQYHGATEIMDKYKDRGWTRTHGFFLLMGGFQLYQNGVPIRTLTVTDFHELYSAGRIDWPTISKEEIEDKSKADAFTKGVVLLQTGWFIVQCIARGAYKLAVTELEVVTLAFAALTGVVYMFWWHKPLDVSCPVPIELKPSKEEAEKLELVKSSTSSSRESPRTPHLPVHEDASIIPHADVPPTQEHISNPRPDGLEPATVILEAPRLPPTEEHVPNLRPEDSFDPTIIMASPNWVPPPRRSRYERILGHIREFRNHLRHQRQERGILLSVFNAFVYQPVAAFCRPFEDMVDCTELKSDNPLRIPTFYAPAIIEDDKDAYSYMASILVTFVFGGIHCIAWSFHFPSLVEQWFWRSTAISVCGLPLIFATFIMQLPDPGEDESAFQQALPIFLIITVFAYIAARLSLLILPLLALRALPADAFLDINWTTIFPHI